MLTVGMLACGGPRDAQRTPAAPPAPPARPPAAAPQPAAPPAARPPATPAAQPPAPAAGRTVDIRMTGNGRDRAAFEPSRVTVRPGTTLRFINVSGGPHNVAFWPDSIPRNAKASLDNAMVRHMGSLASIMVSQPNEAYEMTLPANTPKGVYKAYCQPHLRMGMRIWITVQ
jgi:plastocyanin